MLTLTASFSVKKAALAAIFLLQMTSLTAQASQSADFCKDLKEQGNCPSIQKIGEYLAVRPTYFTDGLFQGQEIDQSVKRPVEIIPELETSDSYFATQFGNQGQFWIARIPKKNIKTVALQLALFDGPLGSTLAHAQLRFKGHQPITLYRLKQGRLVSTATSDFIFTIQAALPKGESYGALDAIRGSYKVVSRLANNADRTREELKEGDVITQYRLVNLTSAQKDLILLNSLKFSSTNLMEMSYMATTSNCINLTLDIIDASLNLKIPRLELNTENIFSNGMSPLEKMTLDAMTERNLIDETSRLPNYKPGQRLD